MYKTERLSERGKVSLGVGGLKFSDNLIFDIQFDIYICLKCSNFIFLVLDYFLSSQVLYLKVCVKIFFE